MNIPRLFIKQSFMGHGLELFMGMFSYFMLARFDGPFSLFSILATLVVIVIGWTSDTQKEIGHIVKVE